MRPYARIVSEMDPSSKAWQRDRTTAAICKWSPDVIYLPFREHFKGDTSFVAKSRNFKNHRSIEGTVNRSSLYVAEKSDDFSSKYKKPTTNRTEECRNAEIFSNIEARCRTTVGKSVNRATNRIKSKLLHEICDHVRRRYTSWSLVKAFAVNNASVNLMNNYLTQHCKCKNDDIVVALDRTSRAITGDTLNTVEEENWIRRTSRKIKSILPDLHAKIRSRSTIALNLYCLENIFAVNKSIPISKVISNRILFASKDCNSKSSILKKIEELCTKKKSSKQKVDRNDICKKRERACKTAEKKCQKREKGVVDCSKERKQTCKEQKKVSCETRKDLPDKEDTCRKTRETKPPEESSKGYKACDTSQTEEDICQKRRVEPKQTSCSESATAKQPEKDICKKSGKDECQKSYESDKCTKEKKPRKEEDERAFCQQRRTKETCQEKKERIYKEEKESEKSCQEEKERVYKEEKESEKLCQEKKKKDVREERKSEKSDCSEIKQIDPCKKKECSPVTKAPGCPDGNGKTDEKEKNCRKYSTRALQNDSQ